MNKKLWFLISLFSICFCISCQNILNDTELKKADDKAFLNIQTGSFVKSRGALVPVGNEDTILPEDIYEDTVKKAELYANDTLIGEWSSDSTSTAIQKMKNDTSIAIDTGKYTFKLLLKNSFDITMAYSVLENTAVVPGRNNLLFKTAFAEEGCGSVSVTIKWNTEVPEKITSVVAGLFTKEDFRIAAEGFDYSKCDINYDDKEQKYSFTYQQISVPAGEYYFSAELRSSTGYAIGKTDAIIIVNPGLVSNDEIDILNLDTTYQIEYIFDDENAYFVEGYDVPYENSVTNALVLPNKNQVVLPGSAFAGWFEVDEEGKYLDPDEDRTLFINSGNVKNKRFKARFVTNKAYMQFNLHTSEDDDGLHISYWWNEILNPVTKGYDFNYGKWFIEVSDEYIEYKWYINGILNTKFNDKYSISLDVNEFEDGAVPVTIVVKTTDEKYYSSTLTAFKTTNAVVTETKFKAYITEETNDGEKETVCFIEEPYLDSNFFNVYEYLYGGNRRNVTKAKFEGILEVGPKTFNCLKKIKEIEFGSGLLTVDEYAFTNCGIEKGKLDKYTNTYELTGSGLTISLPDTVSSIGNYAFSNSGLKEIYIPKNVKTIGSGAFYTPALILEKIEVSPENERFASENGILYDSDKTTLYYYPPAKEDEVYTIPSTVGNILAGAFGFSRNLKKVIFNGSLDELGASAFAYSGIEEFDFNESWGEIIAANTFEHCLNLKKITVSPRVTNVQSNAFGYCPLLEEIIFEGEEAPTFGSWFYECVNPTLYKTYLRDNKLEEFYENIVLTQIKVPATSLLLYKAQVSEACNTDYASFVMANSEFYADVKVIPSTHRSKYLKDEIRNTNSGVYSGLIYTPYYNDENEPIVYNLKFCFESEVIQDTDTYNIRNYLYCNGIENFVIEEINLHGVTTIGQYFARDIPGLLKVTLPDTLKTIGKYSFQFAGGKYILDEENDCAVLVPAQELVIPASVETVEEYAFFEANFETITFEGSDVNFLTDFYYSQIIEGNNFYLNEGNRSNWENHADDIYLTFASCTLNHLNLPSQCSKYVMDDGFILTKDRKTVIWYIDDNVRESVLFPNSVRKVEDRALNYSTCVKTIDFGEANTAIKSYGNYIFYNSSIEYLTLNNKWNNNIPDNLLREAYNLKTLTLTDTIERLGQYTCYNCTSLKEVNFGKGLKTIDYECFGNCSSLEDINYPEEMYITTAGSYIFYYCYSLKHFEWNEHWPSSIGYGSFIYCAGMETFTIGKQVTSIGSSAFEYVNAIEFTFEEGRTAPLSSVGGSIFYGSKYTSFDWNENWGSNIPSNCFYSCSNLKSVTINKNVKTIGTYAFAYCNDILLEGIDNSNNTISLGSYLFAYSKIVTMDWNEKMGKDIPANAFYNCQELTTLNIGKSVKTIGSTAFARCNKLSNISIDEETRLEIPLNTVYNYGEWFADCDGITSFDWTEQWGPVIPDGCFEFCRNLNSIKIGDHVTTIGQRAFYCCCYWSYYTYMDIFRSVNSVTAGGYYPYTPYYGNTVTQYKLTTINIPSSVIRIGNRAFLGTNATINIADKDKGTWYTVKSTTSESSTNYYYQDTSSNYRTYFLLQTPDTASGYFTQITNMNTYFSKDYLCGNNSNNASRTWGLNGNNYYKKVTE